MIPYFFLPILGWCISGVLKLLINSYKFGLKDAKLKVGNGGFPSTHCTTITTPLCFIGLKEGFNTPIFCLGFAILIIVVIDAIGIRKALGEHAKRINQVYTANMKLLRENQGHSLFEAIGGITLGVIVGALVYFIF